MKPKSWSTNLVVAAAVLMVMGACPARADPPPVDPVVLLTGPGALYPSEVATLGFEFDVPISDNATGVVFGLGVFDLFPGPLPQDATVGLWDTSGDLLASGTIPAGGGYGAGFFRFTSIAPFALVSGQDYVVGAFEGGGGVATSLYTPGGGAGAYRVGVDVIEDRFSGVGAFAFPDQSMGYPGGSWLGANLDLAFAIPEPASWTLMLLGFGAMGLASRRARATARDSAAS